MRILTAALSVALFLYVASASAGELDNYYLEKFGEIASKSLKTASKAAALPVAEKCGLPLHKGLRSNWPKLESSTQKVLAKYLARPVLGGEGIVRSNGGHFNIHFTACGSDAPPLTDADNNGIPDWVETVASTFEAVYAREVSQLGYRQPPSMPYDVYLQQLAGLNEFGHTDSETLIGQSATSYIVIDNDFADFIYHPYNGLSGLKITAAHEFHHAIQFGYNFYFDPWYAEATATWIEDEVFDSGNQLYDYLIAYYLQTTLQLDAAVSTSSGGGYGRWSFNRYLSEVFYPTTIIKSIWENLATKLPVNGADIPMLPVINEVLVSNSGSLPSSFLGFSKRFLLNNWASHQNEIGLFPDLTFDATNTFRVTTTFTVPLINLPNYAFQYLKLQPSAQGQLTINYPNIPTAYAMVAFLQSTGSSTQFTADSSGKITIPSVANTDTVYPLTCNNVIGATSTPADLSQSIQPPADAANPFTGNSILIQAPATVCGASNAGTGGGGGNGCFIATAAYGSYLHPKVVILRDFRDHYLLTNTPGRAVVAAYYRLSPPLAAYIARHETLRSVVRILLAPLLLAVEHPWYVLAAMVAGAGTTLLLAVRRRKRRLLHPQAA